MRLKKRWTNAICSSFNGGRGELFRKPQSTDRNIMPIHELAALGAATGKSGGELLCFLVLAPGTSLDDIEPTLRTVLRRELSPLHVPDRFLLIDEVPRTLNGKKCEVPVKKILAGLDPEKAVSRGALRNPEAIACAKEQGLDLPMVTP